MLNQLGARIFAIEEGLRKLTDLLNQNMQNVTKAFALTDGHVHVINHILRDMVKGEVHLSESYQAWKKEHPDTEFYPGEDVFDLKYYFDRFNEMQRRLQQEKMKAAQEKADGKVPNENTGEKSEGDQQGGGESDGNGGDA